MQKIVQCPKRQSGGLEAELHYPYGGSDEATKFVLNIVIQNAGWKLHDIYLI